MIQVRIRLLIGMATALAAAPGTASADPSAPLVPDVAAAADGLAGVPALAAPAVDPSLNLAISFDGMTLFQEGTASATSGTGDLAIAVGADSSATATGGLFDSAFASGTDAGATADGTLDTATAIGTGGDASAGGSGNLDSATAIGPEEEAFVSGGYLDSATAVGSESAAHVAEGNFDVGVVLGDSNVAFAGEGNFDLAAVLLGEMLTASATGGNFLVDIVPSL
jgi:hypothetical protein